MKYEINASSISGKDAALQIKESQIDFGTTAGAEESLPNPAELFLGAFAACLLKNVERFSGLLGFTYSKSNLQVRATRLENPPRMEDVEYRLEIYSNDSNLNIDILKKNIEKHGTIYNTVKQSCTITGTIEVVDNV